MSRPLRCALVASGGGLKAYAFHAGVLRALEEHGFAFRKAHDVHPGWSDAELQIDTYIGSSAGACTAAAATFLADHREAEGVLGLGDRRMPRFGRAVLLQPSMRGIARRRGLFSAAGVEKYFRDIAPCNDFRRLGARLFMCATALNSSRKIIFGPRDSQRAGRYDPYLAYYNDVPVSQAVAASVSVPGLFEPYVIRNATSGRSFEYTDGEVRETLSVHIARDEEVDLVILSNTWVPYHYDARFGTLSRAGLGKILGQAVTQMIEQKVNRQRNAAERYGQVISLLRSFAARHGLASVDVEQLVSQVCDVLHYRPMDEIYIAPDSEDAEFNRTPSWSFSPRWLGIARDRGYERACRALEEWEHRRASDNAVSAGPATARRGSSPA